MTITFQHENLRFSQKDYLLRLFLISEYHQYLDLSNNLGEYPSYLHRGIDPQSTD